MKSMAELIAQDPDIAELAQLARLVPREDEQPEERPLVLEDDAVVRIASGWVERGVDRDCALTVLVQRMAGADGCRPWEETAASRAVRSWLATGRPWLRLQGGRGVGKTWAAGRWIMRAEKQADALLVEGAETVGWADWDPRWEELRTIPRLVIDDCDLPKCKPEMWYSVLAPRYRRRLPTIITTNAIYDPKTQRNEFWEWWGGYKEKLQSRFAEIGHAEQLGGEDLRRRRV